MFLHAIYASIYSFVCCACIHILVITQKGLFDIAFEVVMALYVNLLL